MEIERHRRHGGALFYAIFAAAQRNMQRELEAAVEEATQRAVLNDRTCIYALLCKALARALSVASKNDHAAAVGFLMQHTCITNHPTIAPATFRLRFLPDQNTSVTRLLIEKKADVANVLLTTTCGTRSAVIRAASLDDLNSLSSYQHSPLTMALNQLTACCHHDKIRDKRRDERRILTSVALLLACKADANLPNLRSMRPLSVMCWSKIPVTPVDRATQTAVRLLLYAKADVRLLPCVDRDRVKQLGSDVYESRSKVHESKFKSPRSEVQGP